MYANKKKMYKSLYFFVKWKGGQLLVLSTHLMSNASNVRIFYFTFTSASAYFIFKNWSIKWNAYIPDALLSKWKGIMQSTNHCSILRLVRLTYFVYTQRVSLSLSLPLSFQSMGLGIVRAPAPFKLRYKGRRRKLIDFSTQFCELLFRKNSPKLEEPNWPLKLQALSILTDRLINLLCKATSFARE